MHFFAQIKPKSHMHIMWSHHLRKSAVLDGVLFKQNGDGVYESDELTDEQIDRFRVRPEIVKLVIISGVEVIEEPIQKPKPRPRPRLKE